VEKSHVYIYNKVRVHMRG